jgi:diaminopimelate epimerase
MAGDYREGLTVIEPRRFWKMSGSGNDFVFVDGRSQPADQFENTDVVSAICARGTGVGADGLVILSNPTRSEADLRIRYFNADGSMAELCGNATLCTSSLAVRLGAVDPAGFALETGTGILRARIRSGEAEFDLPEIVETATDVDAIKLLGVEERLGFASVPIPHVVIRVPDVSAYDVVARGREVRHHESLEHGANVNFVSRRPSGGWRIRTYERGVEDETLACGTGSVATALMLRLWGEAGEEVELETASGRVLSIRSAESSSGGWQTSLRGEGRLVFEGELRDL